MRPLIALTLVTLGLLTVVTFRSAAEDDDSETLPGPNTPAGRILSELVKLHNQERAAEKLPPLTANLKLFQAARAHAGDMAEHLTMSHDGSDGSKPEERLKRHKYHYQAEAENVARGQTTVPEVMYTWMHSPPHKKNILGPYKELGGAAVRGKNRQLYWCVDFGTPWPVLEPDRATAELIAAINQERAHTKLPPVKDNPKLRESAQQVAKGMAARERLDSKDAEGKTLFELAAQSGYRFQTLAGEATAGQLTPEDVVKNWLAQPGHRETFLGDYAEIGVGYATDEKGKPYWSVLFAQPLK